MEASIVRKTHVVVGAGTSGLMLTNLLLHKGENVILIESGDDDADKAEVSAAAIEWSYAASVAGQKPEGHILTEAQRSLMNRKLLYPQGSGIGGTSNINACIWSGGNPEVFNEYWPAEWNSEQMEKWLQIARSALQPASVSATRDSAPATILGRAPDTVRKGLRSICVTDRHERSSTSGAGEERKGEREGKWGMGLQDNDSDDGSSAGEEEEEGFKTVGGYKSLGPVCVGNQSCLIDEELELDKLEKEKVWSKPSQWEYLTSTSSSSSSSSPTAPGAECIEGNCNSSNSSSGDSSGRRSRLGNLIRDHCGYGKLTLLTRTHAEFVEFEGRTAVGVAVLRSHQTQSNQNKGNKGKGSSSSFEARSLSNSKASESELEYVRPSGGGEIVLCAGVFHSPRLLIASGLQGEVRSHPESLCGRTIDHGRSRVGRDRSKERGLRKGGGKSKSATRSPLPTLSGIGSGLQDHVVLPVMAIGNWVSCGSKTTNKADAAGCEGTTSITSISRISSVLSWIFYLVWTFWFELVTFSWYANHIEPMLERMRAVPMPANGVHGWVDLDEHGNVLRQHNSHKKGKKGKEGVGEYKYKNTDTEGAKPKCPSAQLVFVDGGCAAGYLPELILPRFESQQEKYGMHARSTSTSTSTSTSVSMHLLNIYCFLRPWLHSLITYIVSLSAVRVILRHVIFGTLVCLTSPHSRGRVYVNDKSLSDEEDERVDTDKGDKGGLSRREECATAASQSRIRLDLNLLSDERDSDILYNALHAAHRLLEDSRQHDNLWYLEALPGLALNYALAADHYETYVTTFAAPYFHACGTCAMEEDHVPLPVPVPVYSQPAHLMHWSDNNYNNNNNTNTIHEGGGDLVGPEVELELELSDQNQNPQSQNQNLTANSSVTSVSTSGATEIEMGRQNEVFGPVSVGGRSQNRPFRGKAVVDSKLRVIGVKGLRVADASVIPKIPSGPIAAVCMAIGVAAAEFLSTTPEKVEKNGKVRKEKEKYKEIISNKVKV